MDGGEESQPPKETQMRILKTRRVIRLGRTETRTLEAGGPEQHDLMQALRRTARDMARGSTRPVEVYASARCGGYMVDQLFAD